MTNEHDIKLPKKPITKGDILQSMIAKERRRINAREQEAEELERSSTPEITLPVTPTIRDYVWALIWFDRLHRNDEEDEDDCRGDSLAHLIDHYAEDVLNTLCKAQGIKPPTCDWFDEQKRRIKETFPKLWDMPKEDEEYKRDLERCREQFERSTRSYFKTEEEPGPMLEQFLVMQADVDPILTALAKAILCGEGKVGTEEYIKWKINQYIKRKIVSICEKDD